MHTILNKDLISGQGSLFTSFDEVEALDKENSNSFFLQFDPMFSIVEDPMDSVLIRKELDYTKGNEGDLIYRASTKRKGVVFDINRRGELTCIGADGDRFRIEDGNLLYYLEGEEEFIDDALFSTGRMLYHEKLYHERSKLYQYPRIS